MSLRHIDKEHARRRSRKARGNAMETGRCSKRLIISEEMEEDTGGGSAARGRRLDDKESQTRESENGKYRK